MSDLLPDPPHEAQPGPVADAEAKEEAELEAELEEATPPPGWRLVWYLMVRLGGPPVMAIIGVGLLALAILLAGGFGWGWLKSRAETVVAAIVACVLVVVLFKSLRRAA